MSKTIITAEMTIAEILEMFPSKSQKLAQTMTNAGLHCSSCSAKTWETLEAGVLGHGMSRDKLNHLLKELNKILEEECDENTITLTPRAAAKFKEFAKEEGLTKCGLRFGDSAGGCGGFQYILDFVECPDQDDATFLSEGVEIYVKKGMVPRLLGSTIDYVDGIHSSGFKISNPNVRSSCGCGSSQNYDD